MKNQRGFIPVIIILIVLIGIVGVYYLGTLKPKAVIVNPTSTPIVSALPSSVVTSVSATPDPTTNWKTYSYGENGLNFSIMYPTDFNIIGKPEIGWNSPALETIMEFSVEIDASKNYKFDKLVILASKTDKTLNEYVKSRIDSNGPSLKIKQNNSLTSIEYVGTYKNELANYLSILNKDYVYSIGLVGIDNMTIFISENSLLLDQILSTFKFTN